MFYRALLSRRFNGASSLPGEHVRGRHGSVILHQLCCGHVDGRENGTNRLRSIVPARQVFPGRSNMYSVFKRPLPVRGWEDNVPRMCGWYLSNGDREGGVPWVCSWYIPDRDRKDGVFWLRRRNLSSRDRENDMSRLHERYLSNGDRKTGVLYQYLLSREVHVK